MERMKESIKAGTLDPPVGIIKLSDLNQGDSDGDGVRLAPQDVPLEDAAASGCRKCINELETGEKDRRMHDSQCPRKFGKRERNARMRLGRKGAVTKTSMGDRVTKKKRKRDRPPPPFAAWARTCPPAGTSSPGADDSERRRWTPLASLEDAARAGCTKCRLELDTGEKTRRAHSDDCPRKFPRQRGGGPEPAPPEARARDDRRSRKKARPSGASGEANGRALPPNYVVPLEKAAESGCRKCRLELETGEKTRQSHDERCPRKWRPKEGSAGGSGAKSAGGHVARDESGKFRPASKPVQKKKRKRDRKAERERRLAREAAARARDTDDEEAAGMLAEGEKTWILRTSRKYRLVT